MKNYIFLLIAAAATPLLNSCSSLSKEDCLRGDWQTIGYEDGSRGATQSRLTSHIDACKSHDVRVNRDAYQVGYREGLTIYCTEANGFELGNRAGSYQGVCPAPLNTPFLDGYLRGLQAKQFAVETELEESRNRLEDQTRLVARIDNRQ